MKLLLITLAGIAVLAGAALAFSHDWSDAASSTSERPPPQSVMYGHIEAMTPKGDAYEIKFDPAWWLTGVAAERAALEDTGSSDVPNDYYVVNEGHRLLTYIVPPTAQVTIVGNGGNGIHARPITVAQLAQLVAGHHPLHQPLFEPLTTGFWLRVRGDTVRSLDQQYVP